MPESSGKKVGVLTFHRCINYGSYWQARGLVEGLRARGHATELLDYCDAPSTVREYRVGLRPTLPTPVPVADVKGYKRKARRFFEAFERLPMSEPFPLDQPEAMESFDAVVIGSDEVWNLRHPWYAGRRAFWGDGLKAKRVVSYAASFGNYSCWEGLGAPFTEYLERFDAISVRDENSWWMLKNALGREFDTVLDPALQFPLAPEGEWTGPETPFALVYGHNFTPEYARAVRAWADARGLPLLSLGYRNDWADAQWLDAGPHDFAHAMARASAVATNFFHGCVFALRSGKPFACETSEYRSIKVRGLMELLGGLDRLVPDGELGERLDTPCDFEARLTELREASDAYLDRALSGTA
jgi:hypothetical protein